LSAQRQLEQGLLNEAHVLSGAFGFPLWTSIIINTPARGEIKPLTNSINSCRHERQAKNRNPQRSKVAGKLAKTTF
jgi:hypothetical protein